MPQQRIIFEGEPLLRLLTAYYDGAVPLDAKLLQVGMSMFLARWVGLLVESEQWGAVAELPGGHGLHPLQLRYEGRRNMSWSKSDGDKPIEWGVEGENFEVPK